MGYKPSPVLGLDIPDSNTEVRETREVIEHHIKQIETYSVMSFASMTDLSTRVPSPREGMLSWIRDINELYVYDGSGWRRVWPTSPRIHSGTTLPSNALGQDGDVYFRR